MTIDEAIKILKTIYNDINVGQQDDDLDATKLGIEALRHINHNRRVDNHPDQAKLPGETKD